MSPASRNPLLPGAVGAPLPDIIRPQLAATPTRPLPGDDWAFEIKYDGYRMLARIDGADVRLFTRNGHDWTDRLAVQARLIRKLGLSSGWIDGELVLLDDSGRPDFEGLQRAFDSRATEAAVFVAFDLMYLDGWDLRAAPLCDRQALLYDRMQEQRPQLRYSEPIAGDPAELLSHTCALGLEGLVAKRQHAPYVSERNGDWIKLKCTRSQMFVVGGFAIPQRAGPRAPVAALLLGEYLDDGRLRYAGRVGTGFTERQGVQMREQLGPLKRSSKPFDLYSTERRFGAAAASEVIWTDPVFETKVCFVEKTRGGHVRHASLRGESLRRRP